MNAKYEDASVEDIQREDTCIICREEMRPWSVTNPQAPPVAPGALPPARQAATNNERSRPKKLPCGHILHLGCLKSWLERQQVCPTCRRSVTDPPPAAPAAGNNANPAIPGAPPPAPGQQNGPGAPLPPHAGRGAGRGMRMLNLGPIRVGFGQANLQDMAQGFGGPQPGQENGVAGGARVYGLELGFPRRHQPQPQTQGANLPGPISIQDHLQQIENQIAGEIRSLQITQQELQLVQLLQVELSRLRLMQNSAADPLPPLGGGVQMPQVPRVFQPPPMFQHPGQVTPQPQMQRHGARANTSAIPAGSADLPPGVVIPEGWTLLPLQRLDGPGGPSIPSVTQTGTVPASGPAAAPTATTNPTITSPTSGTSNNTLTPTPTIIPDNQSHTSSADSSDAIHTPPSTTADQSSSSSATVQNTTIPSNTTLDGALQASSDPSVLPNWGSSQLFSGSSLTPAPNTNEESVPSWQPPQTEDESTAARNALRRSWPNTTNAGEPEDPEEIRQDKGKGKAVSVEDIEDEPEGS